jgi:hypothetical protein
MESEGPTLHPVLNIFGQCSFVVCFGLFLTKFVGGQLFLMISFFFDLGAINSFLCLQELSPVLSPLNTISTIFL